MVKRESVGPISQEKPSVRRFRVHEEYSFIRQSRRRSEYRPVPGRHGFVSDPMAQRVRRSLGAGERHRGEPPPLQFVFIGEVQHRVHVYVDRDQVARLRAADAGEPCVDVVLPVLGDGALRRKRRVQACEPWPLGVPAATRQLDPPDVQRFGAGGDVTPHGAPDPHTKTPASKPASTSSTGRSFPSRR